MIRPTQTGLLFSAVCVLVYFASITSQSTLLLMPIGILIGCGLINALLAWRTVRRVAVQSPAAVRMAEKERISQPWKLTNRGSSAIGRLEIESHGQRILRIAGLAANEAIYVSPQLNFDRRGVHAYGQMKMSSAFPFGLLKASRRLEVPGEIVVHPAVYATDHPQAAGYDVVTGGRYKGRRRLATGTYFAGVRPHQPGDPLKQIHWKSSAKGQGMMVKTFEEELSGRVSIIMDAGHCGDLRLLDDCARAAGSLAFAATQAGDHVEWIDLAHFDPLLMPPSSDGDELLSRLARLEPTGGCIDAVNLERALSRVSRRSAIALVLTAWNEDTARFVAGLLAQRRTVSVYVPQQCRVQLAGLKVFHFSATEIRGESEVATADAKR